MKRLFRLWWCVVLATLLFAGVLVATDFTGALAARDAVTERAEFYKPDCSSRDALCQAWTEFRRTRPYPYQTIAAKPLRRGRELVIVISEPAPLRPKTELENLVKAAFGDDLIACRSMKWKIGIDGWVEDLVLHVRNSPDASSRKKASGADPLDDPLLRDRIALLHLALFGTTYGGRLEPIGASSARNERFGVPNLRITAKELHDWMADPKTKWRPVGREDVPAAAWPSIAAQGTTGAFASEDGSLVMLTFPAKGIRAALQEPDARARLSVEFRRFTVASDAIVGGVWNPQGQATIIARGRMEPLEVLPPLRFETFALLAAQWSDELQQSYERSNALAGKMLTGRYKFRDWAPIYLSKPLIDTELGALLNITDQMLKSWSEAGSVEYMYFAYPLKPGRFPFGRKPLSRIVKEESGSLFVLYNWNTAGSAVVAKFPDLSVLVARQTGSLPVTYGSELKPGQAIETGHLMKYEDRAYEYFAGLTDPNLERVVQYTLMYQLFRAVAADLRQGGPAGQAGKRSSDFVIEARADSGRLLASETTRLLRDLRDGRIRPVVRNFTRNTLDRLDRDIHEKVLPSLQTFHRRHPQVHMKRLATLLADPASERGNVERALARYRSEQDAFNQLVGEYNKLSNALHPQVNQWIRNNPGAVPSSVSTLIEAVPHLPAGLRAKGERLRAMGEELRRRRAALENAQVGERLKEHKQLMDDVGDVCRPLRSVAWAVCDLDAIRREYIARNAAEPDGWIKTPSVVLSWNRESINSEGGHNLNARALRLEPAEGVSDIELAKTDHGLVLRFNPAKTGAVASKATDLARAVEHGQIRNVEDLKKIVASSPVKQRSRFAALEIPEQGVPTPDGGRLPQANAWRGRLGSRVYTERKAFIGDFRAIAEKNDCCRFIVRDEGQSSYVAERNPKPPPSLRIREMGDTYALTRYLADAARKNDARPVVVLGETPEHVIALLMGIDSFHRPGGGLMALAQRLGRRSSREPSVDAGITFIDADLQGRHAALRVIGTPGKLPEPSWIGRILDRLAPFIPEERWTKAEVAQLSAEETRQMLRNAGWSSSRDGVPSAVVVSFGESGGRGQAPKLGVVAGFRRRDSSAGDRVLRLAVRRSSEDASKNGSTIAQYFMTLKKQLQEQDEKSPGLLKRLLFSIDDGESPTLFSELESLHGRIPRSPGQAWHEKTPVLRISSK